VNPITDKLDRAKVQVILDQPFFASLLYRLGFIETDKVDTMGVDGRNIYYNPAFVEKLEPDELIFVLCHEILHVAAAHTLRRNDRHKIKWNIACDLAINQILVDCGMKMPKQGLLDAKFKDMSAEEIYDKLPEVQVVKLSGKGSDPGGTGEVMDMPGEDGGEMSDAERQLAEEENRVQVAQAAQVAKAQGKLPGSLDGFIAEALTPKVNWKDRLRQFVTATIPSDYTWAKGNRRYLGAGLYLPSVARTGVGEIVVVVDTSGSVPDEDVKQFLAEIRAIQEDCQPEKLHVIACDAAVGSAISYEPGDDIPGIKCTRGGTDFRPPFKWVEENGVEPKALIYLTDLEGPFPQDPGYPCLWIATTPHVAPFGETVKIS
jgi:predicted metal-dependent peptidase